MKHWPLSASTALALILSAGPSLALTPEEVWESWKLLTAPSLATVTTESETRNGNALEIRGLTTSVVDPDGITYEFTLDWLTLTDRGDGTVEITNAESYPMVITAPGGPKGTLLLHQPGGSVIASGTAEAISYDFDLPTVTASLTELTDIHGETTDIRVEALLSDITGRYLITPAEGGGHNVTSDGRIGNFALTGSGTNPQTDGSFTGSITIADTVTSSTGRLLDQDSMLDLSAALRDGFAIAAEATTGAISYDLDVSEYGDDTAISGTLGGVVLNVALDAAEMEYGFGLNEGTIAIAAAASGVPPVEAGFGEIFFSFAMPVSQSATPQPFSFVTRLVDISLSDAVWGLVDPGAQLPRDPATLILDLAGTGAWAVDILDPAVQGGMAPMPAVPGTINSLDLRQVLLQIVGGEATATGSLVLDNEDLFSFDGFPAPEGKINVDLKGINALIDKAVSMGFLSPDDVFGVRMGLSMFTRPGSGPDQLVSEIEFKDKGLYVNSQRIK
ncbi:DUF2125 domain-containing protein [Pseudogemmobacter sonorensis]|uniref:DUF2125 domain-containing protein n=1 Tax=Pseudogemmobacter sonorensis TaxID=2989681 RepID=UPI0036B4EAA7